jgi:hypothetical protein
MPEGTTMRVFYYVPEDPSETPTPEVTQ